MKSALIETNYLPGIHYFCLVSPYEHILIEKFEFFEKQTYRNRCHVNTAQGIVMLSVPLEGRHGKVLTKDVRVEAGSKWRNTHWRTIESAYRKAPFFEFYSDELKSILYKGHAFLFDLNFDLLSFCLRSLKMNQTMTATMSYQKNTEGLAELRNRHLSSEMEIQLQKFQITPYQQVFGNSFVSDLSVIDLLFCRGPDSLLIIKSSQLINEV